MKSINLIIITFLVVIIFILSFLLYQVTHNADNRKAQYLVETKLHKIAVIETTFPAIANLQGFVIHFINSPTEKAIVYADKQGRYLVTGNVLDSHGVNITLEETDRYINPGLLNQAYLDAQKLTAIWQGSQHAAHVITLIIDPNSPSFPEQYATLEEYVATNELAVRWVLVSYLKPFGDKTVAAILQASDPVVALKQNALNYHVDTQSGGIPPVPTINAQSEKILEQNWNFMQRYSLTDTPITIFQTKEGKSYLVHGFLLDEMFANIIDSVVSPK